MIDLEQLTAAVRHIATEVGRFQKAEQKNFRRDRVAEKNAHDYVSYVDQESERRLVTALKALLPEAGFIAEEGSATYNGETYCWVVDPLDGTTNYIHGLTPYCVSIALRTRTELLLGVVYEVGLDEAFYAWKGSPAYLNGEVIRVSDIGDMKHALLIAELPYNYLQYKQTAEHLIRSLYGWIGGIRMNGSAALAMCYVAAGRVEGWMEAFIGKWDFSAATLIIRQAGGQVTNFHGDPDCLEGHHIIASNGLIHSELQRLLAEVPPLDL